MSGFLSPAGPACANCMRLIGRLERIWDWQEQPVCAQCYAALQAGVAAVAASEGYAPAFAAPASAPPSVCENCRCEVPPGSLFDLGAHQVCERCYHTLAAQVQDVAPPPPPMPEPLLRALGPYEEPSVFVEPAAAHGNLLPCSTCGQYFGIGELSDENGQWVCKGCVLQNAVTRRYSRRLASNPGSGALIAAGIAIGIAVVIGAIVMLSSGSTTGESTVAAKSGNSATPEVRFTRGGSPAGGISEPAKDRSTPRPPQSSTAETEQPDLPPGRTTELFAGPGTETRRPRETSPPSAQSITPPPVTPMSPGTRDKPATPPNAPAVRPEPPSPASPPMSTGDGAPSIGMFAAGPSGPRPPATIGQRQPLVVPPVTPATRPATPLGNGLAALDQNRLDAAAKLLHQATLSEPKNVTAFHGLGLVYFQLGQKQKARECMEGALTRSQGSPSRILLWNFAAVQLEGGAMRGAKVIAEQVGRPGAPLDEELINALGTLLFRSTPQERSTQFFAETRALYFRLDEMLDASNREGKRRWGTEWVVALDADRKWSGLRQNTEEADRLQIALNRQIEARKKAWGRIYDNRTTFALLSSAQRLEAEETYRAADEEMHRLDTQLVAAQNRLYETEQPPFPKRLDLRPIE